MMTINLLPLKQRSAPNHWRRGLDLFLCLWLLMAAVMMGLYFMQVKRINGLTTASDMIRAEIKQYRRIQRSLTEKEKTLVALNRRINVINRFNYDRARPVALLTEVANLPVKDAIWLTRLEATPAILALSGYSLDERSVAALMTVLEKYDDYPVVTLKSLKREIINRKQPLVAFELVSQSKQE